MPDVKALDSTIHYQGSGNDAWLAASPQMPKLLMTPGPHPSPPPRNRETPAAP